MLKERTPLEVFPPGEFMKEEIEARGWSQADLAEIMNRPPKVISDLITGKRSISPELAKDLAEAFGTSANYWMNLDNIYQLSRSNSSSEDIARRSKLYQFAPIKEMVRRHWIEQSNNLDVLESRVLNFFGVNSFEETPMFMPHAARKGTSYLKYATPAQLAWLFRAKQLGPAVSASSFSDASFEAAITSLKKLLPNIEDIRHIPRILADSGIRFLIIEPLPQTRIDGVTFWLDEKSPVIVLSMRFDRIDWFWFSLSHELDHVRNRDGLRHEISLDTDMVGDQAKPYEDKPDKEKRADRFATSLLVPPEALNDFIMRTRPLYGKLKIMGFANRIGVHPGLVVGQLQYRKEIGYDRFRPMLERVKHIITRSTLTDGWGSYLPAL